MTEPSFAAASPPIRAILESCCEGRALDCDGAEVLFRAGGADLRALVAAADRVRRAQVGDEVTYVVNRNVNFTNACIKSCHFCAFSRKHRSGEAYFLPEEEIVRRAVEARAYGATEICLQAGLAPGMDGRLYVDLCRALKRSVPDLHIHGFSPEEIRYGARLAGRSIRDYLAELRDAGLGSMPGTAAEILDDEVRVRISPGRIRAGEWVEVIRNAHELGIPTSATIMFGHVETVRQRVRHLDLLRALQRDTGGFTELVPLSFVHSEAPMYTRRLVSGLRAGPDEDDVTRLYAIARLMLGKTLPNLQVSWVKQGVRRAQELLACGANDFGGTLMNESISTTAGAGHGQLVSPTRLRAAIRAAGRVPAERTTGYEILRRFERPDDDGDDPLARVTDPAEAFGTFADLARDDSVRFSYSHPRAARR